MSDYAGGNNGKIVERYAYTSPYGEFTVLKGEVSGNEAGNSLAISTIGNVFAHQGLLMDREKGSYSGKIQETFNSIARYAQRPFYGFLPHNFKANLYSVPFEAPTRSWYLNLPGTGNRRDEYDIGCDPHCNSCCCDSWKNDHTFLGLTACQGGRPCCCIYEDRINELYPDNSAWRLILGCIEAHEQAHMTLGHADCTGIHGCYLPTSSTPNKECAAYSAQFKCIRDNAKRMCGPNIKCLIEVLPYIRDTEEQCNVRCHNKEECSR